MTNYSDIRGINFSTLKYMDVSPLAYRHALTTEREDTDAMRIGRCVHLAILEPERFEDAVAVYDGRRAGRDWESFRDAHGTAEILKPDQYADIYNIAKAVRSHPAAVRILTETGTAEVPLVWQMPDDSRIFKGRVDWITPTGLYDIKTARDICPRAFGRAAATYLYHVQMAYYQWGVSIINGSLPGEVAIIAAQNVAPWDVAVYRLTDKQLAAGEDKFFKWLDRLAQCEAANHWPGAVEGAQDLEMPDWALGGDDGLTLQIGGEDYAL